MQVTRSLRSGRHEVDDADDVLRRIPDCERGAGARNNVSEGDRLQIHPAKLSVPVCARAARARWFHLHHCAYGVCFLLHSPHAFFSPSSLLTSLLVTYLWLVFLSPRFPFQAWRLQVFPHCYPSLILHASFNIFLNIYFYKYVNIMYFSLFTQFYKQFPSPGILFQRRMPSLC